ncbi:MAG: hypothetical protein KAS66_04285 [Candidatus Omnitrophica bacterium]|nr:hypothetical protein [Candidatus Omnitrophota bacterium]
MTIKSNLISTITLSDSYFYKKIIKKYQKSRWDLFGFPLMIFSRNIQGIISQKMNIESLISFSFLYMKKKSDHNNAELFNIFFSWFTTEKYMLLQKVKLKLVKNIQDLSEMFKPIQPEPISNAFLTMYMSENEKYGVSFNHSSSYMAENLNFTSQVMQFSSINIGFTPRPAYNVLQSLFIKRSNVSPDNTTSYLPEQLNVRKPSETVNFLQFRPELGLVNSIPLTALSGTKNISFELKNRLTNDPHQNRTSVDRFANENYNYSFIPGTINSLTGKRRTYFTVNNENFIFQNQLKLEQEIEQIKKSIVNTKDSLERSISENNSLERNTKANININHLSDQVYDNIERRIRIEKDRRGL